MTSEKHCLTEAC